MIDVLYAMEESYLESFVNFKTDLDKLKAMATPSEIDRVKAAVQELQVSTGQSFTMDEETGIATIPVLGTLTPKAEVCVSLTDGSQTIYSTITESIKMCEKMPSVKEINFLIDSPGGYVSGVDSVAVAIKSCSKPTTAIVSGMACSAAYWLATQCNEIKALTKLSQVGSIGVLVEVVDRNKKDTEAGIKRYVLTSENAPEKFQDISTKSGRSKIIERLTDIEKVFISRVSDGRSVTEDEVKTNFGKGGVLLAEDALKAGMIDSIIESIKPAEIKTAIVAEDKNNFVPDVSGKNINKNKESNKMATLNELFAENPGAKAEHDKLISAAEGNGIKKGEDLVNARIEGAKNFISNPDYPKSISALAQEVIMGKAEQSSLSAAVTAVDAVMEKSKSDEAKSETTKQPETPADPENKVNDSGQCNTEAEYQAEIARAKAARGL